MRALSFTTQGVSGIFTAVRGSLVWLAALACCGATLAKDQQAGPIKLAANGQSSTRIVIARNAAAPEGFAASELSNYLFKMSGVRVPIVRATGGGTHSLVASYTLEDAG